MITLSQYWMGRQAQFAADWTPQVQANGAYTVNQVNRLLNAFFTANPGAATRGVNSGWRPRALNATIKGAALNSKHITAQACDLSDDDGALDFWINTEAGIAQLESIGLWAEGAKWTPRWTHLQTVAPISGRRFFQP